MEPVVHPPKFAQSITIQSAIITVHLFYFNPFI
jgi:hypothetical protein